MSIKLQTQQLIEKKIAKLVKEGKNLSVAVFTQEYHINAQVIGAEDIDAFEAEDLAKPYKYDDLTFRVEKWKKQCQYLSGKIPLDNTSYSELLKLLADTHNERGRKIVLNGFAIQQIILNLEAILEDLKDGMFENIFLVIELQSVLNHIEQAEELFDENQYALAGLITLCALESFLRGLCAENIDENGNIPDGLVKKARFLKTKQILDKHTTNTIEKDWAKVRNDIAHGDFEKHYKDKIRQIMIEIKALVRGQMPNN